jgi:hypothetical protein
LPDGIAIGCKGTGHPRAQSAGSHADR